MGWDMIVSFDGTIITHGTTERADKIITAQVRPGLVGGARRHWAFDSDVYQFGRGFIAVRRGAPDCPYADMHLAAGRFRLAWDTEVFHIGGTSCGFPAPRRSDGERLSRAAE